MNESEFSYEAWRHGGWYVTNVRYPSGAVGCVSRNFTDRKWRIACDSRVEDHTYASRDEAAAAERDLIANPVAVHEADGGEHVGSIAQRTAVERLRARCSVRGQVLMSDGALSVGFEASNGRDREALIHYDGSRISTHNTYAYA